VLTGEMVDARTAKSLGLVDDVVDPGELDAACKRRALSGTTRASDVTPPTKPPQGFEAAWATFTWTSAFDLLKGTATVEDEKLRKSAKKSTFKAPLAFALADDLIKMSSTSSLAEGLRAETAGLHRIFSTKDALEGLSSVGVRRPTFKGA
jgi:enoyl-CoA hydratase/carnithine racemase